MGSGLSQLATSFPVMEELLCELGWEGLHPQTAWWFQMSRGGQIEGMWLPVLIWLPTFLQAHD